MKKRHLIYLLLLVPLVLFAQGNVTPFFGISGSGTTGKVPKFSATKQITNSDIDNTTSGLVTVGANLSGSGWAHFDSAAQSDTSGDNLSAAVRGTLTSASYADPPFSGTNPPIFSGLLGQTLPPGSITCSGVGCGEASPSTCGVRGVKSTPATGWNNLPTADYGACFDDTVVNGVVTVRTSVKSPLITTNGNTDITVAAGGFGNTYLGNTGGGTVYAQSVVDMASHKITNLTDGSSAQDAAAFGQIASAVSSAGLSGLTTNRLIRATSATAVGNGAFSDDLTTFGKASIWTVTESNGNEKTFGTFEAVGSTTLDDNSNILSGGSTNGYIYTATDELDFYKATNATATGYVNYHGYNGGTTQFRNLVIGDGKAATAASFTGSTKGFTTVGPIESGGAFTADTTAHVVGNATFDANIALAQSGDTYVYDSLATSSGNQSMNVSAAGTGKIRFNTGTGGVTNAGTGGLELDAGGAGTSSVWSVTNGGTSVQSGGATVGSAGYTLASQGGTNDLPSVLSYHGDPNGNVTSNEGSLCMDGLNNTVWINTNSASTWVQLTTGTTVATTYVGLGMFGDGNQGSVTWNSGTTTLTKDIYATDITCNNGAVINTAGFSIYSKGAFTGPSSGSCIIQNNGSNGTAGTIGVGGATGGPGAPSGALPGGKDGGNGNFGGNGGNSSAPVFPTDYRAGCGGSGGGDGTHSGGTCTVSALAATNGSVNSLWLMSIAKVTNLSATAMTGGGGGGGGGGTAVGTGIGGGGGGGGGYVVVVASKFVNPSNITVKANGGNGANGVVSGGSAGGGGGGGGGYVWAVCASGTAPTMTATKGTHGNGAGASGVNGNDGNDGKTSSGYCPLAS